MTMFTFKVLVILFSFNFAQADRGNMPLWGGDVDPFHVSGSERLGLNEASSGENSSESGGPGITGNVGALLGGRAQGFLTGKVVFESLSSPVVDCLIQEGILTPGALLNTDSSDDVYTQFRMIGRGSDGQLNREEDAWDFRRSQVRENEYGAYEFDYWMPSHNRAFAKDLTGRIIACEEQNEGDAPLIVQDNQAVNPQVVPARFNDSRSIQGDVTEI